MIRYYLGLGYRFLPVDSRKLAAQVILLPTLSPTLRCPFHLVRTRGDGVAHTRTREAIINIMYVMRNRQPK